MTFFEQYMPSILETSEKPLTFMWPLNRGHDLELIWPWMGHFFAILGPLKGWEGAGRMCNKCLKFDDDQNNKHLDWVIVTSVPSTCKHMLYHEKPWKGFISHSYHAVERW